MNKLIIIPIPTPHENPYIMVAPVNEEKIKALYLNVEICVSSLVPRDMIYFVNYDEWVKEIINNNVNKLIDE